MTNEHVAQQLCSGSRHISLKNNLKLTSKAIYFLTTSKAFQYCLNQCFGSGSVWIHIIWSDSDPDPDPYQETIDMDPGSVKN